MPANSSYFNRGWSISSDKPIASDHIVSWTRPLSQITLGASESPPDDTIPPKQVVTGSRTFRNILPRVLHEFDRRIVTAETTTSSNSVTYAFIKLIQR
jgi:hypothetical protein